MRALIAVDAQLYRLKDGSIWTPSIYGYDFWRRYLQVFDSIVVAARVMDVEDEKIVENYLRSDGEAVSFSALPFARGAKQYIQKWFRFMHSASKACENIQCAVIREAQCGYAVNAGDWQGLARCIERFIQNREKVPFGDNARRYYDEHFSKKIVMDKLEKELLENQ